MRGSPSSFDKRTHDFISALQSADLEVKSQIRARLTSEASLQTATSELRVALRVAAERGARVLEAEAANSRLGFDMASLVRRLSALRSRNVELERRVGWLNNAEARLGGAAVPTTTTNNNNNAARSVLTTLRSLLIHRQDSGSNSSSPLSTTTAAAADAGDRTTCIPLLRRTTIKSTATMEETRDALTIIMAERDAALAEVDVMKAELSRERAIHDTQLLTIEATVNELVEESILVKDTMKLLASEKRALELELSKLNSASEPPFLHNTNTSITSIPLTPILLRKTGENHHGDAVDDNDL